MVPGSIRGQQLLLSVSSQRQPSAQLPSDPLKAVHPGDVGLAAVSLSSQPVVRIGTTIVCCLPLVGRPPDFSVKKRVMHSVPMTPINPTLLYDLLLTNYPTFHLPRFSLYSFWSFFKVGPPHIAGIVTKQVV